MKALVAATFIFSSTWASAQHARQSQNDFPPNDPTPAGCSDLNAMNGKAFIYSGKSPLLKPSTDSKSPCKIIDATPSHTITGTSFSSMEPDEEFTVSNVKSVPECKKEQTAPPSQFSYQLKRVGSSGAGYTVSCDLSYSGAEVEDVNTFMEVGLHFSPVNSGAVQGVDQGLESGTGSK